ncbi:MAG: Chromosomal replication initiator protein DnaA [Pseudomonadota bacterium]
MTAAAHTVNNLPSAENIWEKTLSQLRQRGNLYALSFLEQLHSARLEGGRLILGVPDRFLRDWIDEHYRGLLVELLSGQAGQPLELTLEVSAARTPLLSSTPTPVANHPTRPHRLNPRFTFDSYVVAENNSLPAAAAAAVADHPGRHYNPLFIYGGTGLGKTHLLHAVGNRVLQKNPQARVLYLSSEDFTNEFVESVRDHRMSEFRRKFRDECDLLLLDDVQFLGKKEETQKEFFHTFNALHELSRGIVLTSDTVPSEIPGLEERLRSRFAMGLITDIHEPTLETRVAILQKKAERDDIPLPDSVATFIARHVLRNVRELEGALMKVEAVHSLTGQPITEEFAAQVLRDVLPQARVLDVDTIQKEVARFYKVPVEELRQDKRVKQVAHARAVAMYLSRKLTRSSFPEIGQQFRKDHSTVISAVRKVEAQRESDARVRSELAELEQRLGA